MLRDTSEKEKEILCYAESFLKDLSERCLNECGKNIGAVEFPVFKRFLNYRTRREVEFNHICLMQASALSETNATLTDEDIQELIHESMRLDKKLQRDIKLLPIRLEFDYTKIIPVRKERIQRLVSLFRNLLDVKEPVNYADMVRRAYSREDFLNLNNELVELYAEEAYIMNLSIKSFFKINIEAIAERMYCAMIEVGFSLNRKNIQAIYGN